MYFSVLILSAVVACAYSLQPGTHRLSCPLDEDGFPMTRYGDDLDCSRYYICDSSFITHLQCPTNKHWSQKDLSCLEKDKVKCVEGAAKAVPVLLRGEQAEPIPESDSKVLSTLSIQEVWENANKKVSEEQSNEY